MNIKNLIISASVITLGAVSAMAQPPATFLFVNDYGGDNNGLLSIASTTSSPSSLIGANATSEALGAGPGQVTVQLYIALEGTVPQFAPGQAGLFPPTNFFLAGTTLNSTSTSSLNQGRFDGGNPYILPAGLDGGVFTPGTMVEYQFFAYNADESYTGLSALGSDCQLGGGANLPTRPFGTGPGQIGSWSIVLTPEPSVIALSTLGAATLLFFRRKKQ